MKLITVSLLLFFTPGFVLFAADDAIIEELKKPDFVAKQASARLKQINTLLAVVKDSSLDMGLRISAVQILGDLRATETIDTFIENLTIITPGKVKEKTLGIMAPCAPALIAIGKQASNKALSELFNEADPWRCTLLLTILCGVEGKKLAQHLLKEALSIAKPGAEKTNIQAALDHPLFKD